MPAIRADPSVAMRVAIAQIGMHWSTQENTASIARALRTAQANGAQVCAFSELAITGFHRRIAAEALPELVDPAVRQVRELCAQLSIAAAVGAPTFGADGARFITHLLIDQHGELRASISKRGLTDAEATFFARGDARPIGVLQGRRCTAVICREVEDLEHVSREVPAGAADIVFLPGALRPDPDKPRTDPPGFIRDAQRLARATRAFVVQTNWPNALNRPEESVDGGQSAVIAPDGELMFRLPRQAAGLGIFDLGQRTYDWIGFAPSPKSGRD